MMDEVVSRRNPVPGVSAPHDEGHYAEWADKRPAENPCWCWGQRHRNFFSELTWTDKLLNNNLWDFISQLQVLFSFSSLLIKSPTAQRAGLSLRGPEWPQHTGVANLVLMAFLITFIFAVSVTSPLCCFIGQVLDHTHTQQQQQEIHLSAAVLKVCSTCNESNGEMKPSVQPTTSVPAANGALWRAGLVPPRFLWCDLEHRSSVQHPQSHPFKQENTLHSERKKSERKVAVWMV